MQDQPVVVAYGISVDSSAMLVGVHRRGIPRVTFKDWEFDPPGLEPYR